MDPKETLAVLGERMLGIIGAAYAHARKCSGEQGEADKLEGQFMRSLLRRGEALHAEYEKFLREQVAAAKNPPPKK